MFIATFVLGYCSLWQIKKKELFAVLFLKPERFYFEMAYEIAELPVYFVLSVAQTRAVFQRNVWSKRVRLTYKHLKYV